MSDVKPARLIQTEDKNVGRETLPGHARDMGPDVEPWLLQLQCYSLRDEFLRDEFG